MRWWILCLAVLSLGCPAFCQSQLEAPASTSLLLVQEIPLPHVEGRIDHFTFDAQRKRVIVATLGNVTIEVVGAFAGSPELNRYYVAAPANDKQDAAVLVYAPVD